MKIDNDILIFRRLIKYYFLIFIIFVIKGIYFPDAFVPDDLQFVIRKYEDEVMEYSYPILIAGIFAVIFYIFSFLMIYKLKKNWRLIHLISLIILMVCLLELRFSFVDSFDYFLEGIMFMINGGILSLAFFGNVSKKFK
tara:strand:- start:308 stop:724 length:417 start_codon:yes stop_codon:yes gene_type:complete